MKEYKPIEEKSTGMVNEPEFSYNIKQPVLEFSNQMMDVLLKQTPQIKIMIINKLSESLLGNEVSSAQETVDIDKESIEKKRDYYRQKYNLPEKLVRLIGCIPPYTDEEIEKIKEEYLMEKYGRQ